MCAGSAELRLTLPRGAAARPRFWGEWEVRADVRAETPFHFRTEAGARGWLMSVSGARFEPLYVLVRAAPFVEEHW
jgi:hypothetical protein